MREDRGACEGGVGVCSFYFAGGVGGKDFGLKGGRGEVLGSVAASTIKRFMFLVNMRLRLVVCFVCLFLSFPSELLCLTVILSCLVVSCCFLYCLCWAFSCPVLPCPACHVCSVFSLCSWNCPSPRQGSTHGHGDVGFAGVG